MFLQVIKERLMYLFNRFPEFVPISNGSGYLVKVLLNEQESALPIATNQWPYYKWEEVKDYYLKKLKAL
jgi:multiple inositol-polyphosphate phosphatase / 2,3-bisphosphoglycerate 3-phosphatase